MTENNLLVAKLFLDDLSCKSKCNEIETLKEVLEEIQQYRALEQKLQSIYGEHEGLLEIIVNGLLRYENAPDKAIKCVLLTDDDVDKWEQLKAIGTIDEFKALKEKSVAKKPIYGDFDENEAEEIIPHKTVCPICGHEFEFGTWNDEENHHCVCGQKLDWSE